MASTLSNLVYHIIFSTKNREAIIVSENREELHRYMGGIIKKQGGVLLQIGGMPDHIHMVIKLKPVHMLSGIMQKVKGGSSKWVNEQHRFVGRFAWQDGYAAFSVSESQISTVIKYVKEQEKHHRFRSFKDEFILILEHHQIDYDERSLWD